MARYQREAGQWAAWFRFNAAQTTSHPVYGTGPQRAWYAPVTLPLLIGEFHRAPKSFEEDALYRVDQAHLIFSYSAFFHSLMPDPDPTGQDHVNDRVGFDGKLFSVATFTPEGRVADEFLTVSVNLFEVGQGELDEDVASPLFASYTVTG